jgi:hypothetical protein
MSDTSDNTQPLDMKSVLGDGTVPVDLPANRDEPVAPAPAALPDALTKHLGWDIDGDGDIEGIEQDVPEPAVLRGAVLTVVGLVGAITGKALHIDWIDQAIAAYAVCVPLVLSVWIRRNVSPVKK